jgi:hypothetical protein
LGITLIQCFRCYCWIKFIDSYICSIKACRLKHVRHLVFVVSNMCVIWCLSSQTCASFGVCRFKHVRHLVFVVSNMYVIWCLSFQTCASFGICRLTHVHHNSFGVCRLTHVHHNSFGVCCLKNVHHLSFVVSNMCITCLLNYHPWLSYGHKLGGGGMHI